MRRNEKEVAKWVGVLVTCIVVLWMGSAHGETIYVPDHYDTIQKATDMAVAGDIIIVRDGVYRSNANVIFAFQEKNITIKSENGPKGCILDGENTCPGGISLMDLPGSRETIISGFTLINFKDGGISCYRASPVIENCVIMNNSSRNLAGAGISLYRSSPLIRNCTISNNSTISGSGGGGIHCFGGSPTITNCIISGNSSDKDEGGGISILVSQPTISNCYISDNTAKSFGGGISMRGSFSASIVNCVITGNKAGSGGGIYADHSTPKITNSTIAMNHKDGIRLLRNADSIVTNCIIWDSKHSISMPIWGENLMHPRPVVTYSNVRGGFKGTGNIDGDPSFMDPENGDFHLKYNSPCINAGANDAPGLGLTDLSGNPRISDTSVDMGAYEYQDGASTGSREDVHVETR